MNDNGQIVGTGYDATGHMLTAVYWSSYTAKPQKLTVPDTAFLPVVSSINNSGQIVGHASVNSAVYSIGLFWSSPSAQPTILKVLPGYIGVAPGFVGPGGQVIVDYSGTTMFYTGPSAVPVALTMLTGDFNTRARCVNSAGIIVGASNGGSTYANSFQHAVTWASATAAPQALPLPPGSSLGLAYATSINTAGVIVGGLGMSVGVYQGILTKTNGIVWQSGQPQDLNALIPSGNSWTMGEASQITDQGWILGTAYDPKNPGTTAQYVLIPK
jgi:hypothetical protein